MYIYTHMVRAAIWACMPTASIGGRHIVIISYGVSNNAPGGIWGRLALLDFGSDDDDCFYYYK